MKSNFEFLIDEWKDIFERAKQSEENAYPDIRASYVFARMCLELALKLAYEIDPDLEKNKYDSLDILINNYEFKQKVNKQLLEKILEIKTEGNKAVHYDKLKHSDPKIILKNLYEFTKWFAKNYSENDFDFNQNFDESILKLHKDKITLSREELLKLEENLKKENQNIIEDFQRKILELEEKIVIQLKKNAELEAEILDLKRLNSENQSVIESFNQYKKGNNKNESFFSFDITEVGITLQKGLIWGRVFINFKYDNQSYFAVKYFSPNELGKVQERHLISNGIFQESELYNLFDTKYDNLSFLDIQSGKYDDYDLVLKFDKRRFGTPSILIEKLLLDLKKQFAFKKGDKEWQENGFYIIDNKEYMSIWTFKNHYNPNSENTTAQNENEAIILLSNNTPFYTSKPDFGSFREIKIYPVENLKEFYSIN